MLDKDARPLTANERMFLMEDDPDTDDTRRDDEPGDWIVAGFEGECSRGGGIFVGNATIRADGDGGWECRECVLDDENAYFEMVEENRRAAS
jgi:hypothetical protein